MCDREPAKDAGARATARLECAMLRVASFVMVGAAVGFLAMACPTSAVASCPSPLGEQRVLVVLANFLDEPSAPFTREEIAEIVLDASNAASVNAYVQEVSYQKAWLSGDVMDWVTVPVNAADCGGFFDVETVGSLLDLLELPNAAASYGRIMIVHPLKPGAGACTPGSTSTLGPLTLGTSEGPICASLLRVAVSDESSLSTTHARALVHELGHSFGVGHAHDLECGRKAVGNVPAVCDLSSPGRDRYDVMGQLGLGGHYSAIFKESFGWLDAGAIENVAALPATVVLDPIELPTTGTHVLKVPAVYELDLPRASTHYFVTYRQAIGRDAIFPELQDPATGVMIRLNSTGPQRAVESALVDTSPHNTSEGLLQVDDSADVVLSVGQTYVDARRGLSIAFTGVAGGGATVTVEDVSPTQNTFANCKAAKSRAAGQRAADLLSAFAENQTSPDPDRLAALVARAQSTFTKAFARAEEKGCGTAGDTEAIGAKVDAFVADVLQDVAP